MRLVFDEMYPKGIMVMSNNRKFYINGAWVDPTEKRLFDVVNPATEELATQISLGSAKDVDKAVKAARAAFSSFSLTTRSDRIELFERIIASFERRFDDIAAAITVEMGSPDWFARDVQTDATLRHLKQAIVILRDFEFEHMIGATRVVREPIGVCGLITPWNWPINQVATKLIPALATGCTVVLKPSELAPLSSIILAEALDEAGVPKGVFNLVNGDGQTVGNAISSHPDIDMVSFTGSTRAGILVAKSAADTVKRVHQELGGKSANIILPGADLGKLVSSGVRRAFTNCGQSCQAPTRMLIHKNQIGEAIAIARTTAESVVVGDPHSAGSELGPLAGKLQFEKVQKLIEVGIAEGATVVAGGPGRPAGLNRGYYVRPTVFSDVTQDMTIAKQEIFGPVLSIMTYESEDEAVSIANGTIYGLAGFVSAGTVEEARRVGNRLRAGRIYLNGAPHGKLLDVEAPFGGYKQSGNGREVGVYGFSEFLEIKAMVGYESTAA